MNAWHIAHVIGLWAGAFSFVVSMYFVVAALSGLAMVDTRRGRWYAGIFVALALLSSIVWSGSCAASDVCEVPHPDSRKDGGT